MPIFVSLKIVKTAKNINEAPTLEECKRFKPDEGWDFAINVETISWVGKWQVDRYRGASFATPDGSVFFTPYDPVEFSPCVVLSAQSMEYKVTGWANLKMSIFWPE